MFSKPPRVSRKSVPVTDNSFVTPANFWQVLKQAVNYDSSLLTDSERAAAITSLQVFGGGYKRWGNEKLSTDIRTLLTMKSDTGSFIKGAMGCGNNLFFF